MKYRPKSNIVTDAWQFDGNNFGEILDIVGKRNVDLDAYIDNFIEVEEMWVDIPPGIAALVWVEPSKQWAGVKAGDYIVQDSEGYFYPCEKTIFEKKYEEFPNTGEVITTSNVALRSIQQGRRFGNIG